MSAMDGAYLVLLFAERALARPKNICLTCIFAPRSGLAQFLHQERSDAKIVTKKISG